jgi:phage shock protein C
MTKRLYRSRQQRILAGVCGGLGEYFDVDPVFVRILTVILTFAHGIGLIAYIVAWIAMPKAPVTVASSQQPESPSATSVEIQPQREPSVWRIYLPGIIFIILGVVFLMDNFFWWFHWHHVWPVLLIVAGAAMIWRSIKHKDNGGGVHESFES